MLSVTVTTVAEGVEYELPIKRFESLDEARAYWAEKGDNPEDVELEIINAAQEQNAKQSTGKDKVRKAIRAHGPDSDEAATAIEEQRASSAEYIIGRPRGGKLGGGMTATAARELGKQVAAAGDDAAEELQALAEKYNIPF
jgi:hypothetical protein